jgi:hypothetical protein
MASRILKLKETTDPQVVSVPCSFAPAGTGAPTSVKGAGILSVVWTSTGLFTITLKDKWAALLACNATLQLAAAAARYIQLGTIDLAGAKTIQVRVIDATGTVQDVAANANNVIHLELILRNGTRSL